MSFREYPVAKDAISAMNKDIKEKQHGSPVGIS